MIIKVIMFIVIVILFLVIIYKKRPPKDANGFRYGQKVWVDSFSPARIIGTTKDGRYFVEVKAGDKYDRYYVSPSQIKNR